jgi:hypothetical protein
MIEHEAQTEEEARPPAKRRRHRLPATSDADVFEEPAPKVKVIEEEEEEEKEPAAQIAITPVATTTPVAKTAPIAVPVAAVVAVRTKPVEREIRPAQFSYKEIAEQATQPFSMESLLDLMPPSKKTEARDVLMKIANSSTMRWDPATGHVYREDDRISSSNSLIDKFMLKRFTSNIATKGNITGYDDFIAALSEARASQRPSAQVGKGSKNVVWLRY